MLYHFLWHIFTHEPDNLCEDISTVFFDNKQYECYCIILVWRYRNDGMIIFWFIKYHLEE